MKEHRVRKELSEKKMATRYPGRIRTNIQNSNPATPASVVRGETKLAKEHENYEKAMTTGGGGPQDKAINQQDAVTTSSGGDIKENEFLRGRRGLAKDTVLRRSGLDIKQDVHHHDLRAAEYNATAYYAQHVASSSSNKLSTFFQGVKTSLPAYWLRFLTRSGNKNKHENNYEEHQNNKQRQRATSSAEDNKVDLHDKASASTSYLHTLVYSLPTGCGTTSKTGETTTLEQQAACFAKFTKQTLTPTLKNHFFSDGNKVAKEALEKVFLLFEEGPSSSTDAGDRRVI